MSTPTQSPALSGWLAVTSREIARLAYTVTDGGNQRVGPMEGVAAKTVATERASCFADGWFGDEAGRVRVALVGAAWAAMGATLSALIGLVELGGSQREDIPDLPTWVGDRLRAELGQPVPRRGWLAGGTAA